MSAKFLFPDKTDFIPDFKETARYLGYRKSVVPEEKVSELIQKGAEEMRNVMNPQSVFEVFSLELNEERQEISFADVTIKSRDLMNNLKACRKVALMACTIGPQADALIRRNSSLNPVYASILQATGAMYIEEVVDFTNAEIKKIAGEQGLRTRPRYSPGYGNVPLEIQREFFRLLPCTRIGLTLMDTLIMAPEKSVTAFVGMMQE